MFQPNQTGSFRENRYSNFDFFFQYSYYWCTFLQLGSKGTQRTSQHRIINKGYLVVSRQERRSLRQNPNGLQLLLRRA